MPIFVYGGGGGANLSAVTADIGDVMLGKSFVGADGRPKTGTMANRGAVSTDITTKAQEVTIAQGYHSGSGKVKLSTAEQTKIIETNILGGVSILGVLGTAYNWISATGSFTSEYPGFKYHYTIPITNMSAIGMIVVYSSDASSVRCQLATTVHPATSGTLYAYPDMYNYTWNLQSDGIFISLPGEYKYIGTYNYYVLGVE